MSEEPEAKVEAPVLQHSTEPQTDEGINPLGEESTSGVGGHGEASDSGRGYLADEREAVQDAGQLNDLVPYEKEGHEYPIVSFKGKEFYAIKRYGNGSNTSYTEYREVGAPLQGNGTYTAITPSTSTELSELRRGDLLQRKTDRRKAYEDAVYGALDEVARLQLSILGAASDPHADMGYEDIQKAKLGLQVAESILNRALGKPVTKIDAEVSMSVADEMMEVVEGWVVDEEEA